MKKKDRAFVAMNVAVLTTSDSRTEETDTSGKALVDHLTEAGHKLYEKIILRDDIYELRAIVSRWIADKNVDVVLVTGGTGMTGRDITPEALLPLFDKNIEGFGELFRWISYQEISTSTIQSRAIAGVANGTLIFCMPGSTGACNTAWNSILKDQLDIRNGPCNFAEQLPRLKEK